MNRFIFLILAIALWLSTNAFSEIYRSVDKDGNVTYSDHPDIDAEKMEFQELTTYTSPPQKQIKKAGNKKTGQTGNHAPDASYSGLKILSPASKDTIRDNTGSVAVQLQVTPKLRIKLGHRFVLSIDGKQVASTTVPRYKLTNIDRGSHTLTAQIMNQKNKALTRPVSVSFHMHRHSKLFKKP